MVGAHLRLKFKERGCRAALHLSTANQNSKRSLDIKLSRPGEDDVCWTSRANYCLTIAGRKRSRTSETILAASSVSISKPRLTLRSAS